MIWLLFAHFIGDSAMQPERHAMKKGIVLRYMISHCFIYAGVVSSALLYLHTYALWKAIFILISHFIIDMSLRTKDVEKTGWIGWVDQGLHILCLGVII
jgi:hypothetical protein